MFNWRNLFNKHLDPDDLELTDMATEDMSSQDLPPQDIKTKEIPVLDDIIKEDEDENELIQDYPHLSSNPENESAAEGTTEDTSSEELEAEKATACTEIDDEIIPAEIDESDTAELSYTDTIETTAHEINSDLTIDLNDDLNDDTSSGSEDLVTPAVSAVSQLTTTDSEQLDGIVDRIVEHLMPDLEQQLRFLVQQALEKELPKEFINSLNKSGNKNSPSED